MIERPLFGCRIIYLSENSKAPDGKRFPRGHLDSIHCPETIPENYGIALDNQYIVVDIDNPRVAAIAEVKYPKTWTQATKKGTHYLYKAPNGFKGQNRKLKNSKGVIFGDLKCKGYIVGPGSTINEFKYHIIDGMSPQPCPQDLLDLMSTSESIDLGTSERSGIPTGSHDEFLIQLAGWLRGRHGLSEEAILRVLHKGPLQALQDVDPTRPYTLADIQRIAHSIAKKEATQADIGLSPAGWESYTDIDTTMPLNDWWMYRFIPKNELVMLYGKGGIGKSSLLSYVAYLVAKEKKKIGFSGIEEPFLRFATRAALADKDITEEMLAGLINIGSQWQFPRDANALREALLICPLDVLYFDSIYGTFEAMDGLNTAERARHCLAPLAAIAQELGVTIICTFHENKAGDFLGSVEMVNVARIVLHATREKDADLKLTVKKTNFTEPDHALSFSGSLIPGCSRDGSPWLEKNEDGEVVPLELFVITDRRKSTGDTEREEQDDPRWPVIQEYLDQGYSIREIATTIDIAKSTVQDIITKRGKIKTVTAISLD